MGAGKQILLLVGTRKGAFIYQADEARESWSVSGPHFPGWSVHHLQYDPRHGRLFAVLDHMVYGANLHYSDDLGANWQISEGLQLPDGKAVPRLWHLLPGHEDRPDTVWLGGDPGILFRSDDRGHSWQIVDGIFEHPTRSGWMAGAGGLMVHTIVQDPTAADRLYVAISAAGVFRTDDGGQTWQPKNKGVLATFLPDHYPEVGQCCHHLVMSPTDPELLFQQNHCGVFRSRDGGDSWEDIGAGLPATFGFPIGINQRQPQTIFVIPQQSDEFRYTVDGRLRVYRSVDGGGSWVALSKGLPQENAFLNIYREAMATDNCASGGVYFGTSSGQLYASRDNGDHWEMLAGTLPPVYAVETVSL